MFTTDVDNIANAKAYRATTTGESAQSTLNRVGHPYDLIEECKLCCSVFAGSRSSTSNANALWCVQMSSCNASLFSKFCDAWLLC